VKVQPITIEALQGRKMDFESAWLSQRGASVLVIGMDGEAPGVEQNFSVRTKRGWGMLLGGGIKGCSP
jgi:hypothetical protein